MTAAPTPSTAPTANPSHSPRTSAARSDWRGFDGQVAGALNSQPATTKGQGASLICTQYGDVAGSLTARGDSSPCADRGQNVVCMADDNARAAIDEDVCGSLKVGGGSPLIAAAPTSSARYAPGTTRESATKTSGTES